MPERPNTPAVEAAISGESELARHKVDPFPPEGTDEKLVTSNPDGDEGLSQDDRLAATRAWLRAEREKKSQS